MGSAKKKSLTTRQATQIATSVPYLAYISLAFAGMMWVFSFLDYYHAYPVTTFYQEWGTALLGLAAMLPLLGKEYWKRAEIPRIVMLPIGLMLLVVLQYAMGKMPYFGQMLLYDCGDHLGTVEGVAAQVAVDNGHLPEQHRQHQKNE